MDIKINNVVEHVGSMEAMIPDMDMTDEGVREDFKSMAQDLLAQMLEFADFQECILKVDVYKNHR